MKSKKKFESIYHIFQQKENNKNKIPHASWTHVVIIALPKNNFVISRMSKELIIKLNLITV